MTERTEGLEFSNVVGIRCECADCGEHYTLDCGKVLDPRDFIRCPKCTGLPADRPVPVAMTLTQWDMVTDALVSLGCARRLAATQSKEPRPKVKLSFEVRSKA
jgi:hypothetical protein